MAGRLWYDKQPQQQPDISPPQRCQQKTRQGDNTEEEEEEEKEDKDDEEEGGVLQTSRRPVCDYSQAFGNPARTGFTSYPLLPEPSDSLGSVSLGLFCSSPQPRFRLPGRAQKLFSSKKHPQPTPDKFPARKPFFKRQRRLEEKFFRRQHFSYDIPLKLKTNKSNSAKLLLGRKSRKLPPALTSSKLFAASSRRGDFVEDKSHLRLSALPSDRHRGWRVGLADTLRPCALAATVFSLRPAARQRPYPADSTETALGFDHVVLQPLLQKVVYAADCVSDHQGTGMASRSLHSLPSTTTTITTTTTTSTISNNSSSSSSKTAACTSNTSNSGQQQHKYHNYPRQSDYHYPRDHLQAHQPHTINPGGQQHHYTLQTTKQQQQHHLHQQQCQQQQQCCVQSSLCPTMPPACHTQYYPSRIAMPDGEERSHVTSLGRHNREKVSELKRQYIKPPANITLFDAHHCKSRQSSPSPGDLSHAPSMLPPFCTPHLQVSPTPPPPLSPSQSTPSRPHKSQAREKDSSRGGSGHLSPQPTRKSKNILNYMAATLTSSPKNRKESNSRKSSQQNSGYSNSSFSSCSSNSSSSSSNANSCCNSSNYKTLLGMGGGRGRVRGSSTTSGDPSGIPSEGDNLQGYSTLSSSLPSPELPPIQASLRDPLTPSVLTEHSSTEGLSSSIACPTGPSSVSEVTLLACHPSSMNACSHSSCIISQQQTPIHYQQQHYQQPQYLQPQYQHHDDRPYSPLQSHQAAETSPPHYHKQQSYPLHHHHHHHHHHHQQTHHNPLTSSISSSPPASPSCAFPPPSTSPERFEELSGLPSREEEVQTHLGDTPEFLRDGIAICPILRSGSSSRAGRSSSSRPSSLTSDDMLLASQHPPSYREVLEHPDRFREPPAPFSTTSSSSPPTNTRNIISLTSVPCDNDSIEGGSCNSPAGAVRDGATSRSRGGVSDHGCLDRQRCCDPSLSPVPDSESSSEEGDDDPGQDPSPLSERRHSPTSTREALYGSCYEKEVI